jgi:hypothetical protein
MGLVGIVLASFALLTCINTEFIPAFRVVCPSWNLLSWNGGFVVTRNVRENLYWKVPIRRMNELVRCDELCETEQHWVAVLHRRYECCMTHLQISTPKLDCQHLVTREPTSIGDGVRGLLVYLLQTISHSRPKLTISSVLHFLN